MTRSARWLFLVSAALFLSGVALVVAAAKTSRDVPKIETTALKPVATVKQIMAGITMPAATDVWMSVSTTVDATGVHEEAPKNEEEWTAVGNSAAALIESANLLMMDGRAVDKGDWMKFSQQMADSSLRALKGAQAKNGEEIVAAGETINVACDNCHQRYQRN